MAAFNQPLNSNRGAAYEALSLWVSPDGAGFDAAAVNPVLTLPTGLRDPSILQGDDGAWYLTATAAGLDAPTCTSFPVLRSTDLKTWTEIAEIDCTDIIDALPGAVEPSAWGPVLHRDASGVYIFVTINATGGLAWLQALDPDLTTWTDPAELEVNDTPNGYLTDAGIIEIDGTYHLWGADGSGGLGHATSDQLTGPYTFVTGNQRFGSADYIEGAQPVEIAPRRWRLYFDQSYEQPAPGMSYVDTTDPTLETGWSTLEVCRILGAPNAGRLRNAHVTPL